MEKQIVFHGAVCHSKVLELLRNKCDIYIQPSLQEGLPRSVIEAMSCALPCICSDVAGIPELIDSMFLFDRSKNIPKQIVRLIRCMDVKSRVEQSVKNFNTARQYSYPILRQRRYDFLREFIVDNVK